MNDYKTTYALWLEKATEDGLKPELQAMDDQAIKDAFYKDLTFGTGGLRGIIGPGTNRMNVYTVRCASQGLADYLLSTPSSSANSSYSASSASDAHTVNAVRSTEDGKRISIVMARDSRIKSREFSDAAIGVFAANGIHVYAFDDIAPTPLLSFAVRYLHASAGIVITASHNPKEYNGYKVYGSDGCQITTEVARSIQECINSVDIFDTTYPMPWTTAKNYGLMEAVDKSVYEAYIQSVMNQSVLYNDTIDKSASIVYTPLNGTGLKPVTDVLHSSSYNNITVVESQAVPDGTFPTCPKPNPEEQSAMEKGLKACRECSANLLIATDPDADRCGIAIKDGSDYRLLTANETGLLLLDYICSQREAHHTLPENGLFIKTIVTNDLAEKIAESYGLKTINTLTGFKFIGEQISALEKAGKEADFIFAFEESYGYLTGSYVRDKDGVLAAFLICEMYSFWQSAGVSLLQRLERIYKSFGFCLNTQHSYKFEGAEGMSRMKSIMQSFRTTPPTTLADQHVKIVEDYSEGLNGLPPSDVLKIYSQYSSVVIRPSGTEPKLKVYISVTATNEANAQSVEDLISSQIEERITAV